MRAREQARHVRLSFPPTALPPPGAPRGRRTRACGPAGTSLVVVEGEPQRADWDGERVEPWGGEAGVAHTGSSAGTRDAVA